MFERFTERARRVIILAREEAGRFRHCRDQIPRLDRNDAPGRVEEEDIGEAEAGKPALLDAE